MLEPAPTHALALAVAALATLVSPALAQQNATPTAKQATDDKAFAPDPPGLYANADLSYVLTSGNSSSSSLGFKGDVTRRWA
jgi:putative salt-induced outer membrane protein YdiY